MSRLFSTRGARLALALAMLAVLGGAGSAHGIGDLNPKAITITLPNDIQWRKTAAAETATLYGDPSKPGYYVVLQKWLPHNNSRPHFHPNDRYIQVLSGTWWVNSGTDFDPDATVPVPAGGFVRRVAHTPHYDGVKKGAREPVVIGIFGLAPVDLKLVDPSKPAWRYA